MTSEKDNGTITSRTEILFVYDIADANPNGDPNDENRPRMDVETGHAKVSDVRLKRTIRDYLRDYGGHEIFCRQIEKDDGTIQDGKDRAEDFFKDIEQEAKANADNVLKKRNLIAKGVIEKCIDVRLFGATIPVSATKKNEKDSSVTLTGAVQFAMGTSLHRVEPRFIKGTGAFASGQGAQQKTFREEYSLPYGLIAFYGLVNQQTAKTTKLKVEDAELLYEAIWYGTKNLITRSKLGQRPLLLLLIEYAPEYANSYIGRLDRYLDVARSESGSVKRSNPNVKSTSEIRDEEIRDASDVVLNLDKLSQALTDKANKIARIRYVWDKRLELSQMPNDTNNTFLGCKAAKLEFE